MQIFVKTLAGKAIALTIETNDTIAVVKQKIQDMEDIPVENQHIIFCGMQLEDETILAGYNLQSSGPMRLVIRSSDSGS